jgi:RNA polymerase sigma-70 factor (ECF subfamily)
VTDLDALTSTFLTQLPRPAAPHGSAPQDLPELLRRLEQAGRTVWPGLALPPERFIAYLAARMAPDYTDLRLALADVHAEDLYLACACCAVAGAEAVPGAVQAFRQRYRAVIQAVVRGVDPAPSFADEVEQTLFRRLFVVEKRAGGGDGDGGHLPRITNYSGRGSLAAWVSVAAQRTAFSLRRDEVAQKRARERAMADRLSVDLDPELLYLKQRYRAEFEIAFERAVAGLSDRERTLLRMHLVAGLTLDAIGIMYRVNASTVSRWLASTREGLSVETEKDLRQRLHLTPAEFDSLARLVVSQLDMSICRLLQEPKAGPPGT